MIQALPRDEAYHQPTPSVAPASVAPVAMEAAPLPVHAMDEASIWQRLRVARMSETERCAAVDALLLGRDIGRVLLWLQRAMCRWMGGGTGSRHARHVSGRKADAPGGRLYRASQPGHAPTSRLK